MSRSKSPIPPSPLGPGFRSLSPARSQSPNGRPKTESQVANFDRSNTPLIRPRPTHLAPAISLRPPSEHRVSTASSVRDSSSSGFDFMEAMLAPYEREDNKGEDGDVEFIRGPNHVTFTPHDGSDGPRAGARRDRAPDKVSFLESHDRVRSLSGQVDDDSSTERRSIVHFPSPNTGYPPMSQIRSDTSRQPSPQQSTNHSLRPSPRIVVPMSPRTPPAAHQVSRQVYAIPQLPPTGTPVSPHLAAPPASPAPSLSPPKSPFAEPSLASHRSSTSSESIAGYDLLKEKKALFRGGEDEVFSPISPRKGRQESGLRPGARARNGVPSTMDFWKRFSVSVNKLDAMQMEKGQSGDSEWLSDAQKRRNRSKCLIIAALILLLIIIVAVTVGVVVAKQNEPEPSTLKPVCIRSPGGSGGGAAAGATGAGC
ncbi:hypothetical protein BD324DRAFT_610076 [Kockovaella imperatae]|uniref:Uncharacterized protein n=1 Tax=Kockovaella imperatae TaxID=4999 RepID=A0A1Y1U8V1_9TREE|nr:hypothetical protein BD324DRAFT_610076 [Kockovaella imperatae]ORX34471.1 hypothetical protein BD324DRAFT_610076 [Kockovaella imperatae]